MDKTGRLDVLAVVLLGEGEASVGEIIPCGPSREAQLLSQIVTDGDADNRMLVYGGLDCRPMARCDAATSNLIVGIVESPKGRMACWMAACRMALDED
jgi:hypothetical protein